MSTTDDYVAQTSAAYDSTAAQFEDSTKGMINDVELDLLASLLPSTNSPILDAGCAYGRDCAYLDGKGFDVRGIDISGELIARAKNLHPNLWFRLMDVRSIKLPDFSVRGIWSNAVLLHLTDNDIRRALHEFQRVLSPSGVLAVSFKEGKGSREVVEKFSSDAVRFYNFKTQSEVNAILTEAGFRVAKSYILNERERFGPDKRDLNWIWSFVIKD